jgi:tRNA(adenine34) deaminase
MQAITAAMSSLGGKYLSDCTLYVTVEPCVMCGGALAWSQIGRVVYGAPDPKRGYSTYSERIMHPKTKVVAGVLQDECEAVMKRFFADLRK